MPPSIRTLLLDFDGVLVDYDRRQRLRVLGELLGREPSRIQAALYDSGLEQRYDAGEIDTGDYLAELGDGLRCKVTAAHWLQARAAASRPRPTVIARIAAVAQRVPIAVLTNNGPLLARMLPERVPGLFPALHGRVLCSGTLGGRKPELAVYARALARIDADASTTLFIDDLFRNVRAARHAGLQADTAHDPRSVGRVLGRYGL